jgi:predicted RNase H-like HicB family nuclease
MTEAINVSELIAWLRSFRCTSWDADWGACGHCEACKLAEAANQLEAYQTALAQADEALDQLLDDMGSDGLCVCQEAKDEAAVALTAIRTLSPPSQEGQVNEQRSKILSRPLRSWRAWSLPKMSNGRGALGQLF